MMRGGGGGGMRPSGPPGYAGAPPRTESSDLDSYYTGPPAGAAAAAQRGPGPASPTTGMRRGGEDEFVAGPIGMAMEMDERTGSPPTAAGHGHAPMAGMAGMAMSGPGGYGGLRDSDQDVAGLVGLQRERDREREREGEHHPGMGARMESGRSEGVRSVGSVYSDHTYVPPRAQWAPQADNPDPSHPLSTSSAAVPSSNVLPLSPTSPRQAHMPAPSSPRHRRAPSDAYYEDVDPRFAVDPASEVGGGGGGDLPTAMTAGTGFVGAYGGGSGPQQPLQHQRPAQQQQQQDPRLLQAPGRSYHSGGGGGGERSAIPSFVSGSDDLGTPASDPSLPAAEYSNESLPTGARSPGEGSEASHFTSVSQRPVNPHWRPGPGPGTAYGGGGGGGMGMQGMMQQGMHQGQGQQQGSMMGGTTASAAQRRREDVILNANPDFSLPGMGGQGRGGFRARGGGGGAGMGMSPQQGGRGGGGGLTPAGRYPSGDI
ncbi:regulator of ime2 [Teratosphaeriaceae sp. CCFEE 6253]|nr:regulator of ime2 [Teratosphaeriaceae sp. CCFEE 6253]